MTFRGVGIFFSDCLSIKRYMRPCSSSSTSQECVITIKNFTNFAKISIFCKIIIEPGILPSIFPLIVQSAVVFYDIWAGLAWPASVDRFVRFWSITRSTSPSPLSWYSSVSVSPSHNSPQYLLFDTHFHWCHHFVSSLYFQ